MQDIYGSSGKGVSTQDSKTPVQEHGVALRPRGHQDRGQKALSPGGGVVGGVMVCREEEVCRELDI